MVWLDFGGSTMVLRASLPMYNLPEMQRENAALWQAVLVEAGRVKGGRLGVGGLPEELDYSRKPVPEGIGGADVFTQVCGWPLQTIYAGQAVVIGVPEYDAAHCEGASHSGVFVVGAGAGYQSVEDLRGCDFVFNSVHSNSGMNLPRRAIADLAGGAGFFGSIIETHSQPGNLERVARGEADATCVDCVTYAFFARHRPGLAAGLRILAATAPTPAIPFVTSVGTDLSMREVLVEALARVGRAPEWAEVRRGMMLRGIAGAAEADYSVPCRYATEAAALGYPVLF